MVRAVLLVLLLSPACKKESPCDKAKPHGTLSWIADDYPAALACAKQKQVPLVLDLWAPWCHTCLSMQTTVFTDPALAAEASKFVFASLDTDRPQNADAVGKFAVSAWPTFYVISKDEAVLARFIGAATLTQFRDFLASGSRAAAGGTAAAEARLLGAQRALAKKDFVTADEELGDALAEAPAEWPQRAEALNALIMVKSKRGDVLGCLDVAEKHMDASGNTALATNFISFAQDCAKKATTVPDRAKAVRERGIARMRAILAEQNSPLSVDDRAEAMGYLRDALVANEQPAEAKQVAEQLRVLLDSAMDNAKTPMEAMTHLWLRCEVYAWLERPLDLAPAVEKLAGQLPKEYDPPARLGWLYLKGRKLDEAAKWTERAIALAYGPRKARVLAQRAEIAKAAGDKATERKYREQVVQLWQSLPAAQQSADSLERAKQLLAEVDAPPAGSALGTAGSAAGSATGSATPRH